jgi:hypothetical protein
VCVGSRKGSGAWGRGREMRSRGRVHGGERGLFVGRRFRQVGPTEQREWASEWSAGLMSGAHGTAREGARARRRLAPGSERERKEHTGAGWRRQAGTTYQREASAHVGLKWAGLGPAWAEMVFPFFSEFLIDFLFIFSSELNSNSNSNIDSNSNMSNICIKQKNNLGSA